jgi:acyl-coenzyme A synthetase/AMP-(fatty) acid ligase
LNEPIPLLAHTSPEAPVAYRAGKPVAAWQFLVDVEHLATLIPPGVAVLNACTDRYRFAVGLAAAFIGDRISLLPPTHTPEVVRQIRAMTPGAICLTDHRHCSIDLPQIMFPDTPAPRAPQWRVPLVPAQRVVADVFTSGSTGLPLPHRKRWGPLVDCVRVAAARLGFDHADTMTVVATVPPQHMYGLETSVLLSLQSGDAFCAEHPFYPADICSVLTAVPPPRTLVSTPVHLRALLATNLPLPALHAIVSATAPLDAALAQQVEQRFDAPLVEIYGSTESGQIASRRPTHSEIWHLYPGVTLNNKAGRVWASGGHIETAVALGDHVEVLDEQHFELGDRLQDVVNIAGKRNSIAYLNHQLLSIPGVQDGTFFLPQESRDSPTGVARLCALVVAPGLDSATVLRHLRERIDPVFLPRPLRLIAALPRNSTGKLSVQTLRSLMEQC